MASIEKIQKKVVNNFNGTINHYYHYEAPVTYNGPVNFGADREASTQPQTAYTDEVVARALLNITGKGKALDSKQKWAGAHWLLRWVSNYPVRPLDFCERINRLPFEEELEIKCEYNNIRALSTLSFMNEDPRQLDSVRYSKNDEQVFHQLKSVVVALSQELQKFMVPSTGI